MTMFRLSDEQRRYFYALCSDGNITRAAQRLFLSRQGLSRSMRELEKSLGTSLFVRGKRGVTLTSAGRILLRHLLLQIRVLIPYHLISRRRWKNLFARFVF